MNHTTTAKIDLNTCKPGQKLKTLAGDTVTYAGLSRDVAPLANVRDYPHRVDLGDGPEGYTKDGRFLSFRSSPEARDIAEILPFENPVDDIDDSSPAPDKPPRGWVPVKFTGDDKIQKHDYLSDITQWAKGLIGSPGVIYTPMGSIFRHPDRFKIAPTQTATPAKTETALELYLKGQKLANFQPGDRVKVLFAVPDNANGWDNTWAKDMDCSVGKVGVVRDRGFRPEMGVQVLVDGETYSYPWFCLERVFVEPVKVKLNDTWTAEVMSKYEVKVGCQTFETGNLRSLLSSFDEPPMGDVGLNGSYAAKWRYSVPTAVEIGGRVVTIEKLRELLAAVDAFPA